MAKYVSLNENAGIFHDIASGFTVYKGEIKELTVKAQASNKVKKAILNGHLVYAELAKEEVETKQEADNSNSPEKLVKKFQSALKKGQTDKLSNFSFEDLKVMAESLNLVVEEGDTAESLIEAIFEELKSE